MIRLGEMTPFGTVLRKKPSTEMTELDKYFKRQHDMGKGQQRKKIKICSNVGKEVKKKLNDPLKRSILMPEKRKKKIKLGTKTSKNPRYVNVIL